MGGVDSEGSHTPEAEGLCQERQGLLGGEKTDLERRSGRAQIQAEGSLVPTVLLNTLLWEYRREEKVLHREKPAWIPNYSGYTGSETWDHERLRHKP